MASTHSVNQEPDHSQAPAVTHWAWHDQSRLWTRSGRHPLVRALCGQLIRENMVTSEPSCPACRRLLAEDEASLIAEMEGW